MDYLLKALDSENEAERIYAIQDISELNDPRFTVPLINRLRLEQSPPVKESIVLYLKKVECSDIYNDLFQLFRSTDAYLRNAAVTLFGSDGERAVRFLEKHLDDADKEVRKLILDALYETRSEKAKIVIRAGLHDPSDNVVITSVEYLGLLGDSESTDAFIKMLQRDTVPMLKTSLLNAILKINNSEVMANTLTIVMQENSIKNIDPLYFPEVIRLVAYIKSEAEISTAISEIDHLHVYADDVIQALYIAKNRFQQILNSRTIVEMIIEIIQNNDIQNAIRSSAIELLLESTAVTTDQHFQLAMQLKDDADMLCEAVRFFELSGREDGTSEITDIMNTTKDPEVRVLCEEIVCK
jgi:hypothetical protein